MRVAVYVFTLGAVCAICPVSAIGQEVNGSMRVDYQNTDTRVADGLVSQQYYLRLTDRLFVKNVVVFTSNVHYRTGNQVQPVEFRPRYDLQLTNVSYSGRIGYEPHTVRREGGANEENRLWRGGVQLTPSKLPRLGFDMLRSEKSTKGERQGSDHWNAYNLNWQDGSRLLAGAYSRQRRASSDTLSETLETYRAMVANDFALPADGRLNLAYNFDRTTDQRVNLRATESDQHVPSASASLSPTRWLQWSAQYSGRYMTRRTEGLDQENSNDQLATGTVSITPSARWSFGVIRYFERAEDRGEQEGRSTDYWQVRASTDRVFFRRINGQFTVYRISYTGAERGARYSDAYFVALRGRPHRHAELSTEASLSDRHGLQQLRYATTTTSYVRLYPTHGSQAQLSYNAVAEANALDDFDVSEESFTASLQYNPDARLSLSGGATSRRNRRIEGAWTTNWTLSSTYRWPNFVNLSVYYVNREAAEVRQSPASGVATQLPAQESLLLTVDWWLSASTSLSTNSSWLDGGDAGSRTTWGVGITTQF